MSWRRAEMGMDVSDLIDFDRYPIHAGGAAREAIVNKVRADLAHDGCAVIRSFLRPRAIELLTDEADRVAELGHRSFNKTNVYFTADEPSLPKPTRAGSTSSGRTRSSRQITLPGMGFCEKSTMRRVLIGSFRIACKSRGFTVMPIRWRM